MRQLIVNSFGEVNRFFGKFAIKLRYKFDAICKKRKKRGFIKKPHVDDVPHILKEIFKCALFKHQKSFVKKFHLLKLIFTEKSHFDALMSNPVQYKFMKNKVWVNPFNDCKKVCRVVSGYFGILTFSIVVLINDPLLPVIC